VPSCASDKLSGAVNPGRYRTDVHAAQRAAWRWGRAGPHRGRTILRAGLL